MLRGRCQQENCSPLWSKISHFGFPRASFKGIVGDNVPPVAAVRFSRPQLFKNQQFPLMTCESCTTYAGGRLSKHFDHPFLSFEATCTIRTDTIPGGKQVHFAVQAELRHGDGK